jgi:DNA-binding NarL/FixJ family response regulator
MVRTTELMHNEAVRAEEQKPRETQHDEVRRLSFRERQVVKLIQQAKLNKEIAYELQLTEGTIKEYLNRIFRKLGVKNRTELAIWAFMQRDAA